MDDSWNDWVDGSRSRNARMNDRGAYYFEVDLLRNDPNAPTGTMRRCPNPDCPKGYTIHRKCPDCFWETKK